jgi:hypothetical protein
MKGDSYVYEKYSKLLSRTQNRDGYICFYSYDNQGNLMERKFMDKQRAFGDNKYTYDSQNRLLMQTEYDYFDGQPQESQKYIFEYSKDTLSKELKVDMYFIPQTTENEITKTDRKGNQQTRLFTFTAKTKTLEETVVYNSKMERVRKIEYGRNGKPSFIWTYEYTYEK